MGNPLAVFADVSLLWTPLTSADQGRVDGLIVKASALLRQKIPWVDQRVVLFGQDPMNLGGLDPAVVANVIATMVKRYLSNPDGATNSNRTVGPYAEARGYALRGDKDIRGELVVTESDVAALTPAVKSRARIGTIKARGRLAPWPFGDLGNPALAGSSSSFDSWLLVQGLSDPAGEFGPLIGYRGGE